MLSPAVPSLHLMAAVIITSDVVELTAVDEVASIKAVRQASEAVATLVPTVAVGLLAVVVPTSQPTHDRIYHNIPSEGSYTPVTPYLTRCPS